MVATAPCAWAHLIRGARTPGGPSRLGYAILLGPVSQGSFRRRLEDEERTMHRSMGCLEDLARKEKRMMAGYR